LEFILNFRFLFFLNAARTGGFGSQFAPCIDIDICRATASARSVRLAAGLSLLMMINPLVPFYDLLLSDLMR
jgi:hypothetical protein